MTFASDTGPLVRIRVPGGRFFAPETCIYRDFTYMVVVYVAARTILIAEAGGKSETVAPRMEDFRKAFTGIRAGGV